MEKWNKYIRKKIVRQGGYLQELDRDARSKNLKLCNTG